eukprot:TRINITY_DN95691_c0_g1_i1.p1 TRINITY_DN95691_c0_g1~~TRINITY_DN95691_c0_g1_i1.p1  ORF type:complete len:259 (+),score=41.38 TRINITY_DN95691_c0_g1_i1:80-778(+)
MSRGSSLGRRDRDREGAYGASCNTTSSRSKGLNVATSRTSFDALRSGRAHSEADLSSPRRQNSALLRMGSGSPPSSHTWREGIRSHMGSLRAPSEVELQGFNTNESNADKVLRTEVANQLREMASLRAENARLSDRLTAAGVETKPQTLNIGGRGTAAAPAQSPRRRAVKSAKQFIQSQTSKSSQRDASGRGATSQRSGRMPSSLAAWSPARATGHWTTGAKAVISASRTIR